MNTNNLNALKKFYHANKGKLVGFRFKDHVKPSAEFNIKAQK